MVVRGADPIDIAELERTVHEADAAALLVPPRILRRVIKQDRGLTFVGWHVARRKSYVIAAETLSAIVAEDELGSWSRDRKSPTALLLVRPDPQELAGRPAGEVLLEYWRILFRARVEQVVGSRFAAGRISPGELRDRIEGIGPTAFEEIRSVLRQEGYLLPPRDKPMVYTQFAAVFMELRRFAPALLAHFFPAIEDPEAIEELLAADVDANVLWTATRLAGAPELSTGTGTEGPVLEDAEREEFRAAASAQPPRRGARAARSLFRWLIVHAERAGARGNLVRAAIDRARAGLLVGPLLAVQASVSARNELDRLVRRLQAALGFDAREYEEWRQALPPLLERAMHGFWTPEGRLLYDLQRVCLDREREVFTVDLVEWALSRGRVPIKRRLPHLCEVLISIHLRSAWQRLRAARISTTERSRLADLIDGAVRRVEEAVRDRFRPLIAEVFSSTGIRPHNVPEIVSSHKLVEELLDRIVRRGFLNLGDLRDACSRSNLKLPDLSGPSEFFRGDRLLQTDRALSVALSGVYRRGEIYLRWLQRLSTVAFATRTGRFLTLYAVLPYSGAFVLLEGMQHLVKPLVHWLAGLDVHMMHWLSVLYLGSVTSGLINSPRYRRYFLEALGQAGRGLRVILIELPARLLRLTLIRLVLDSPVALFLWRYLIKPLLVALPAFLLGTGAGLPRSETTLLAAVVFVSAAVVLNSRLGRDFEEILADSAVRIFRELYHNVIPGLFRLILSTFDRILEAIERVLYAVDEWLRFRSRQRRGVLVAKAILGLVWFFVSYVVRFSVNLLIEPQFNPIKHFPVVTVSHKVILTTLSYPLTMLLKASPLGPRFAPLVAGTIMLLLPGVFGFLVWELKENWRLYEANRPESLRPVVVGDHGETMGGLLRPGIHSGTVPKLFAKLRKSEHRAGAGPRGDEKAAFKRLEALHHVEDSIRRFVERDLIALVHESRTLRDAAVEVGTIHLATNRVRIELRSQLVEPESARSRLWIEFDERHDALIAGIGGPGWLPRLTEEQRRVMSTALIGLFKMCAVDWVRVLPEMRPRSEDGGPDRADVVEAQEDLPWLLDRFHVPAVRRDGVAAVSLLPFRSVSVTWKRWVETWQREQGGAKHQARFIKGYTILTP
jgi:hypothetical protein